MTDVKVTIVSYEDYKEAEASDEGFRPPSQWYCLDAMQNQVYFHYRGRVKSQQKCNEYYGFHKYTVRPSTIRGSRDNITAN